MSWQETLTEYAASFIEGLVHSGVKEVVISPGSRSTPLAMLFVEHQDIQVYMNIDERSASFFALGLAKASDRPVALLCTSGTAAANYFPAVIEASLSRVPLIVLTADRPHELRDIGAPQAIDQLHLFGKYVRWFADMALPESGKEMLKYAKTSAIRAASMAKGVLPGPVHVNFPLREPLVPKMEQPFHYASHTALPYVTEGHLTIPFETYKEIADQCSGVEKGLIVCGNIDKPGFPEAVLALANSLGFPILADPLSQLRSGSFEKEMVIECYDAFLKSDRVKEKLKPELVIQFGGQPVSKPLSLFLKGLRESSEQLIIDGGGGWRDPNRASTHMIQCDEIAFCQQMEPLLEKKKGTSWKKMWIDLNQRTKNIIQSYIQSISDMEEGKTVSKLCGLLPPDSTVYIGNSMPIRDMDTYFHTNEKNIRLIANRGANGIDGVVSSALGAAVHCRPLFLLIGDLSFFHDMNGLLAAKLYKININIILLNNDGGGIFSHLPQAEEGKNFELIFGTPTGLNFEHTAMMYNGQYTKVLDLEDLSVSVGEATSNEGLNIIEVPTDRERNVQVHRELWEQVSREINNYLQSDETC
ncbi:2-succinyl-5-enolpyruvyl-6-hydroxy-3-cyclohexene- 1-carboxylate synthase [Siminovitchia terrae]|uniref:2-succinyl-5-enolpyruvyl-6-hydroxy-3-cyclohexene-1-carboxylate synthase n=1 Tax=Siminovitchia terrae TaxID=1914933 RepID=A0ABQ4L4C0_SIMTE|nr:2-succinyl-5-enolpyruvyl-6-hydroxy-3-cyclohexene-1-carboxylic-acid synthase [Siminovitchia terrae]GIN93127.1 2-succinyl-5-enolpyruvyl-6-hydroxy-3-cyclohexene- 1-carboxylate synthase [Siminovitchia terrae]GIN98862.1 2-succinyl-5-enolpyruvyl-6-hydroxy-3-cyclohexene- 1-carboxylate synthase [Siminovitchia terrae]